MSFEKPTYEELEERLAKAEATIRALRRGGVDHVVGSGTEEPARVSEATLRLFVEDAPFALSMYDRQMRYLAASARWKADYGLAARDVVGESHYGLFPEIPERWREVHRRGIAGEVLSNDEDRFVRLDGSVQWVRWEVRPWHTADGAVGGIVVSAQDITRRKQAEIALRESQERLELALAGAELGLWDWDVQSGGVTVNERWAEMLGYQYSEIEPHQRSWEKLLHPDDVAGVRESLNAHLAGESDLYETEHRLRHKSGEWIWVLAKGKVIERDAAGRPLRACGTHLDITERRRAAEDVESAHSFLDTVVDMSPFAMWVSDREGTVIRTNRSLRDALNLTDDAIIGHYNVLTDANLEIQGVMPVVKAVFSRRHEPARFSIPWKAVESGNIAPDGAHDLYIDVAMFPILNTEGELINVVCQWVDISDQRRAEEALRENEQRFRSIVENANDIICTLTPDGEFAYLSPNMLELLGRDPAELIGKPYTAIMHPDDVPACDEIFRRVMCSGERARSPEYRLRHKDGSWQWHISSLSVLKDAGGSVTQLLGISRDVSERKRAEVSLRESERRLNDAQRIARMGDFTWDTGTGAVFWSDALFDLLGYARIEDFDYARVNQEIHHPEDLERVTRWLNQCVASGDDRLTPKEYRLIRGGRRDHIRAHRRRDSATGGEAPGSLRFGPGCHRTETRARRAAREPAATEHVDEQSARHGVLLSKRSRLDDGVRQRRVFPAHRLPTGRACG